MKGRAVFLYNPASGRGRATRKVIVEQSAALWKNAGWETELVETLGPGSTTAQASEILNKGCDVLFACGGDGTVHEVLQALVPTHTPAALGIVPLGTGNVIANNLGLPHHSPDAARMQLAYSPRKVGVGQMLASHISGEAFTRYFLAAAGVGLHASMMAEANPQAKNRRGMVAYYRSGFRLLFTEKAPALEAEITLADGTVVHRTAYELLAINIAKFAGIVRRWRPGGSLLEPTLRLMLIKTQNRALLFTGALRCMIGGSPQLRGVEMLTATKVRCKTASGAAGIPAMAEVDGEAVGTVPIELSVIPNAITLLMP